MKSGIDVDVAVRLPLSEIQQLPAPQRHALLMGVAQVINALPREHAQPPSAAAVDPSAPGTPSTREKV